MHEADRDRDPRLPSPKEWRNHPCLAESAFPAQRCSGEDGQSLRTQSPITGVSCISLQLTCGIHPSSLQFWLLCSSVVKLGCSRCSAPSVLRETCSSPWWQFATA